MAGVGEFAFLNGKFVEAAKAGVSAFDRGFLFGDAIYEVTAVYGGKLVDFDGHVKRFHRSMSELALTCPLNSDALRNMHDELVAKNALDEGIIYMQLSRGMVLDRDFPPAADMHPTLFAFAAPKQLIDTPAARNGISVKIYDDVRWLRRNIKTTQLLAQTLAKTAARHDGVDDAWMEDPDGFITEAASANAWIVTQNGTLVTRNLSNRILAGITRDRVISGLGKLNMEERAFTRSEALDAKEAFSTSASALVAPVVEIDGYTIGEGRPGPVTRTLQKAYFAHMGADLQTVAPWVLNHKEN